MRSELKDDEASNAFNNSAHETSKPEPDVSENMDDTESANLAAAEKNKLSHWNDLGENTICHTSLI